LNPLALRLGARTVGEYLVDLFPTREAGQEDIERWKREDEMYETAQ